MPPRRASSPWPRKRAEYTPGAPAPAGSGGFGYDPIFLYPPFGRTAAECREEQKAAISHRGRAFRDLARWLAAGNLLPRT